MVPTFKNLRQEDCWELEASWGDIAKPSIKNNNNNKLVDYGGTCIWEVEAGEVRNSKLSSVI